MCTYGVGFSVVCSEVRAMLEPWLAEQQDCSPAFCMYIRHINTAASMKKALIYLVLILLTACASAETDSLASEILIDYQAKIDARYTLYASFGVFDELSEEIRNTPPIVTKVKVYHIWGKKYIGLAWIDIDGTQELRRIRIAADEDTYYWEVLE